jgi:hypothetical protein
VRGTVSFSRPFYAVMSESKPHAGVRPMLVDQHTSFATATADMAFTQPEWNTKGVIIVDHCRIGTTAPARIDHVDGRDQGLNAGGDPAGLNPALEDVRQKLFDVRADRGGSAAHRDVVVECRPRRPHRLVLGNAGAAVVTSSSTFRRIFTAFAYCTARANWLCLPR